MNGYTPVRYRPAMPVARITVTAVSDEGHQVVVWGTPSHRPGERVGYVFATKGADADTELAERASRLMAEAEVVVDYTFVTDGWNLARGMWAS